MKNKAMIVLTILLIFIMAIGMVACSKNDNSVEGLELSTSSISIAVGEEYQLESKVLPSGTAAEVSYTSKNIDIATVTGGLVKGVSAGTTTIVAKAGNYQASCTVTVYDPNVAVTGVGLSQESISLVEGDSVTLVATVLPTTATNQNVTWASSNKGVATVDSGVVTAVAAGTTTISVCTEDGGYTAKCEVTVTTNTIEVTGVSLNISSAALEVGDSIKLSTTVTPQNATYQEVTWTTSNSSVATVQDGKVTGVSAGTATVTAKVGDVQASCTVTVKEVVTQNDVESVSLDKSTLGLVIGDSDTLVATILPSDADNLNVTWESSNPTVATVNNGTVTALSAGTTIITVTTEDGGYQATCTVTVSKEEIAVAGVSLNVSSLTLEVGDEYALQATIAPSDATNTSLEWTSTNSKIVAVSGGKITAVSAGVAVVKATTEDGDYTASCTVTVKEPVVNVTNVYLNYDNYIIYTDKTINLTATVYPSDATNQSVRWTSSNEEVAVVNGSGLVTANAVGETTITVTTTDGGYQATCVITVIAEETESEDYDVDEDDSDILIITASGTYELARNYKQIYVDAEDADVEIRLNGYTVENDENSPIYVVTCNSIDISANGTTVSYIKDTRSAYTADEDGQGKGAIYVENGDLKLKGSGTLYIETGYLNGIHGKDDVEIKNLTLCITAVNHGIRGNDSITIESGTIDISCGGDGLHTENSDISSKGNQRGNVIITGGTLTINSWGDAIAAAYNVYVSEEDSAVPTVLTLKTNKYSSYDGETVATSTSAFYLKMNFSAYSSGSYTYAAYIDGTWYKATYVGTQSTSSMSGGPGGGMGGGSTYYIYKIEKPTTATSFTLYRFKGSNVTSFSTSSYNAVSDAKAFNSAYDMVQISVSSSKISFGSWSNYAASSSNSAEVSAKGIKAENEIYISGGTLDIKAYDDAIHTNNDGTLENGSSPLGNVNISGGTVTLYASDDGIHADYKLTISGGYVNITSSYEGLEGNLINISGGSTYVFATDDGVNATSGKSTAAITVSGGLLDVTVPSSGDTDGIDSNGTYTQTGGVVIVKGPGSASGNTMGAAALDTDSTVKITGGTLVVFGGIEQTPSTSNVTKTLCSSSTVSTGSHTISFASSSTMYTTKLTYSTSGCVCYSALGTATLK